MFPNLAVMHTVFCQGFGTLQIDAVICVFFAWIYFVFVFDVLMLMFPYEPDGIFI